MALISFFDTESFVKETISIYCVARCELLTMCTVWKGSLKFFDIFFFVCVFFCFWGAFFLSSYEKGRVGSINHCVFGRNLKIAPSRLAICS